MTPSDVLISSKLPTGSWLTTTRLKLAVTDLLASITKLQADVPLHAPLQPAKVEPVVGVAVKLTLVPVVKVAEQADPQLMELPLTVPDPAPDLETVKV